MRKHSKLAFTLLAIGSGIALSGCSDSELPPNTVTASGGAVGASMAGTAGTTMAGSSGLSSAGMSSAGGSAGASGAAGGTAGLAGSAGTGPKCDVGSLQPFSRSDTDAAWDDNDFSDIVIDQAVCPVLVDVTWPHEAGWENADPSEANFEQVRFTLDSYPVVDDLTNKQLNVTIELAEEMLGPLATDGGYIVSLVSVSTFQRVVPVATGGAGGSSGAGGTDGGVAGMGGSGGTGGTMAGMGGASVSGAGGSSGIGGAFAMSGADAGGMGGAAGMTVGGGGTDAGGTAGNSGGGGGEMTVTETGYAEAETPEEERRVLYYPGDRVTVRFPLPAKTAEDSYDPATAIKVNIRVYNRFGTGEDEPTGVAGGGGMAGMGGMSAAGAGGMSGMAGGGGRSGAGGVSGAGGSAGVSGMAGGGGMAGTSGVATAGISGEAGTAGAGGAGGMSGAGGTGNMQPLPVYDYVTSTFAITNFTVTDVGAP
jgi:hypothetical protein